MKKTTHNNQTNPETMEVLNALLREYYDLMYNIQYNIFPNSYFLGDKRELAIKTFISNKKFAYKLLNIMCDMISITRFIPFPVIYNESDFNSKNEIILNGDNNFNMLTLIFPKGLAPVLSEKVYVLYSDDFKLVRYLTFENTFGTETEACLCEVHLDKTGNTMRENYGRLPKDDKFVKAKILELWNVKPLTENDFILKGKDTNNAVKNTKKRNLLSLKGGCWWTYTIGDDMHTYRNIAPGDSIDKVFDCYGKISINDFEYYKDEFVIMSMELHRGKKNINIGDFSSIIDEKNIKYCEYTYNDFNKTGLIRFYFGIDKQVKIIAYICK